MFDLVHNNKQFVMIALGLVTVGLVVGSGMAGYGDNFEEPYLAKVGSQKIRERDVQEFVGGETVTEAVRPQVVEQLVRRSMLVQEADKQYVLISDAQLQKIILGREEFKDNGQFSLDRYKNILAARQMSIPVFEQRIRDDLRLNAMVAGFQDASFSSRRVTDHLASALSEPRRISFANLLPQQYFDKVTVTDADIKKYFDEHATDFRSPERVKLEYAVLSQEEIASQITIAPTDVLTEFEKNKDRYTKEKRRARHILITADAKATPEQKAAALKKAESLLAQVKQKPEQFAELAKQNSQDPGSASNGGDLGLFGRGTMVKPFEEATFKLKPGEISPVVTTDFGYHIIQLQDVKADGFDDVKDSIASALRNQRAKQQFDTASVSFRELVYQKAESLQPVVDELKLKTRSSDWLTREAASDPLLNEAKVREAVFAEDVLKKKHNTEAVEIRPGLLVSARVAAYEPARSLALDEAKSQITEKLRLKLAADLAGKEGQEKLAALQKGEKPALTWSAPQPVSRMKALGFPEKAVESIFGTPAEKLPIYVGLMGEGMKGYQLFLVEKAEQSAIPEQEKTALSNALLQAGVQLTMLGYLNDLQSRYKIDNLSAVVAAGETN